MLEPGDENSEDATTLDRYDVGVSDPYRNGLRLSSEVQGDAGRFRINQAM